MKARKEKVTIASIAMKNKVASSQVKHLLLSAEKILSDPDRTERNKKNLCKCCYYINNVRMGGASFTQKDCGLCDKEMVFSSTATDVICPSCASDNYLCKQCGADLEYKNRKSYRFNK